MSLHQEDMSFHKTKLMINLSLLDPHIIPFSESSVLVACLTTHIKYHTITLPKFIFDSDISHTYQQSVVSLFLGLYAKMSNHVIYGNSLTTKQLFFFLVKGIHLFSIPQFPLTLLCLFPTSASPPIHSFCFC